jgi:glycosyltransferase involved in cell wall biosynthesis
MSAVVTLPNDLAIDVSVVVPCYRCTGTLDRAIESVLAQTELPKELILVDDASGDETLAALYSWRDRLPNFIRVLALSVNQGAGAARNAGWAIAEGEYIAFLDADDSWQPNKIATQYRFMLSHPEVVLSGHGHSIGIVLENNLMLYPIPIVDIQWWRLLAKNPFVTPSVMVRKDVVPRFWAGRRYMEDHLLWMELALDKRRVVRLNMPLAILHKEQVGVAGLSSHIRAMSKADITNYWLLYRKGVLGLPLLLLCSAWVCVKFFRRSLVVGIPRLWNSRRILHD